MWSIGNGIPARSQEEGAEWQWRLADAVKRIDPTRPVTAPLNGVLGQTGIAGEGTPRPGRAGTPNEASTVFLDIVGFRVAYQPGRIKAAAWRGGAEIGRSVLTTGGEPAALRLRAGRALLRHCRCTGLSGPERRSGNRHRRRGRGAGRRLR